MKNLTKKSILKLNPSSTLVINEKSKKLIGKGKKVYSFGFGQSPFPVPESIVNKLKENGFLVKVESIKNKVPYGDRSNTIIEPLLTEQWFVNAKSLSKKPIQIVKKNKTSFFPKNWTKIFFNWMNEIEPWCISRQIWWGHRIPAWYGDDNQIFVATNI